VLGRYALNSLLLAVGVGAGTVVIGVATAWLVAMCRFPGRRVFEWALLLPLAMPAYVIAYTYTGLLDFAGPVQTALREVTGWTRRDYAFPPVRSLGGAVLMLSLVLYPYVYLLARTAFLEQSVCVLEASRTLGLGPWRSFRRVALPLARPAIVAGLALVMMETLSDFGTVQFFAVDTFTTGIFRAWFGLGEPAAAAQLGAMLMLPVLALLALERWSRGAARFHHTSGRWRPLPRLALGGWRAGLASAACALPVTFSFLLPAGVLLAWAIETAPRVMDARFFGFAASSVILSAAAAVIAVLIAALLAYAVRLAPSSRVRRFLVRAAAMGYSIPGSVVAIGLLLALGTIDRWLDGAARTLLGVSTGLFLSGTAAGLVYAYVVRFLAVALGAVESGLARITPSMDAAARTLGHGAGRTLLRVHLPMLRGSFLAAGLLVFVDAMKELPATIVMRPFGFDTLAVRTYQLANDEFLREAAAPGLAIVLAGLLPVIMLSRILARSRAGGTE
jgi:iron(III) transport system permease protein